MSYNTGISKKSEHDMYLEFGETGEGKQAVHISQAHSADDIRCPYCGNPLVTQRRPGHITQFVHTGNPCRYVLHYWQEDHIRVPLYGEFLQMFSSHEDLTWAQDLSRSWPQELSWSQQERLLEGSLPLAEFFTLQQPLITQAFLRFCEELLTPKTPEQQQSFLTDLKHFEWIQQKFTDFILYLVAVDIDPESRRQSSGFSQQNPASSILYHLGSSDLLKKPYVQRLQQELAASALSPVAIRCVVTLPHMSCIAPYVCFRVRRQQAAHYGFDLPAEYFVFSETSTPYTLSDLLQELRALRYVRPEHREKIRQGMQRAKALGKVLGRPKEGVERFLGKKTSQEIATLLRKNLRPQEVQRRTGYSMNTIRKVRDLLPKD